MRRRVLCIATGVEKLAFRWRFHDVRWRLGRSLYSIIMLILCCLCAPWRSDGCFYKSFLFWKAGAISPRPSLSSCNRREECSNGTCRRYRRICKCRFSFVQSQWSASPACSKCKCGWMGFHPEECKEVLHVSFTPPFWKKLILFRFISLLVNII